MSMNKISSELEGTTVIMLVHNPSHVDVHLKKLEEIGAKTFAIKQAGIVEQLIYNRQSFFCFVSTSVNPLERESFAELLIQNYNCSVIYFAEEEGAAFVEPLKSLPAQRIIEAPLTSEVLVERVKKLKFLKEQDQGFRLNIDEYMREQKRKASLTDKEKELEKLGIQVFRRK